ncbi:MAG: bifunctional 4-hydroxy-2-oxoglutarate aldolase/2-dehydro-3-deoxy-phosphogluconate aldolase [Flavisolibacter sp.]
MLKKEEALALLSHQKLLPLYYDDSSAVSLEILKALYHAGLRMVEYTARGDQALANISELRKIIPETLPQMVLGIGTIKSAEQAQQFVEAGADFLVCPSLNLEVGALAQKAGLLWIPGCMTPTEISAAERAGAQTIKIFPGNILGPAYIRALKEIFPNLKFIPTGGVEASEENLLEWFDAGVLGVGMGSKLFTRQLIKDKDYKGLELAARRALDLVQQAEKKSRNKNMDPATGV